MNVELLNEYKNIELNIELPDKWQVNEWIKNNLIETNKFNKINVDFEHEQEV